MLGVWIKGKEKKIIDLINEIVGDERSMSFVDVTVQVQQRHYITMFTNT